MSDDAPPKARQLNPFAFQAETDTRFTLMTIAAVLLACSLGFVATNLVGIGTHFVEAQSWRSENVYEKEGLFQGDPATLSERLTEINLRYSLQYAAINFQLFLIAVQNALPIVAIICLMIAAAYILFRTHPARIRRRKHLRLLTAEVDPPLLAAVHQLGAVAGMPPPAVEIGSADKAADGQAFGFKPSHVLRLGGGVRLLLRKAPGEFRAIVLHELGHIANQDVERAYFSESLWAAVVLTLMLPLILIVIALYARRVMIGDLAAAKVITPILLLAQLGVMLSIVARIRRGALQTREMYADWRADLWGAGAGLLSILKRQPTQAPARHWWSEAWGLHPDAAERARTLEDPAALFKIGTGIPFFSGFLIALLIGTLMFAAQYVMPILTTLDLAVGNSMTAWFWSVVGSLDLSIITFLTAVLPFLLGLIIFGPWLVALFVIAHLLTSGLGLQVRRDVAAQTCAGRAGLAGYLRMVGPAALVALGLAVGFIVAPLGVLFPIAALPDPTFPLANKLAGLALLPVWVIASTGLAWLWMVYQRFAASRLLRAEIGTKPSRWWGELVSAASTGLLALLLLPLLASLFVISFVMTGNEATSTGTLFLTAIPVTLVLSLTLYGLIFGGTWLALALRQAVRRARCPHCGQVTRRRSAITQACEHCGSDLAPWLFVQPLPQA